MAFLKQTIEQNKASAKNTQSEIIKAHLFEYFRFSRALHCVSEAVCYYPKDIEDIIAFDNSSCICVEVKISKSDFIADFKTKEKHRDKASKYSRFYFCVPAVLKDFALQYLKDYDYCGLLIFQNNKIYVAKYANTNEIDKVLHTNIMQILIMRMSSELATQKMKGVCDDISRI